MPASPSPRAWPVCQLGLGRKIPCMASSGAAQPYKVQCLPLIHLYTGGSQPSRAGLVLQDCSELQKTSGCPIAPKRCGTTMARQCASHNFFLANHYIEPCGCNKALRSACHWLIPEESSRNVEHLACLMQEAILCFKGPDAPSQPQIVLICQRTRLTMPPGMSSQSSFWQGQHI